jgi:hypothetical protein
MGTCAWTPNVPAPNDFTNATIVVHADKVVHLIIETYLAPNKTFRDIPEILDSAAMNPWREFSNACHDELR